MLSSYRLPYLASEARLSCQKQRLLETNRGRTVSNIPGKPRRRELDFVRGIAILMVMFYHFAKPATECLILDAFARFMELTGSHGVDLFFTLSGYLVGGLLIKEYRDTGSVKPVRFLMRRALKIWPAYYLLILFHALRHDHPLHTFFWQNFFNVQNYLGSSLRQTWTLAIEEQFYVFLAVLVAFIAAHKWKPQRILGLFFSVCAIAFTSRCLTAYLGCYDGASHWTQNRIDSLMTGAILAVIFHLMPATYTRLTARAWPLVALSLSGSLFMLYARDPFLINGPGYTVLCIAACSFIILVDTRSRKIRTWWLYRAVSWIGVYSYSLYLFHGTVLGVGNNLSLKYHGVWAWIMVMAFQLAGSLIISYTASHLVEWPFLRLRESVPFLRDTKDPHKQDTLITTFNKNTLGAAHL
jgi:peptidoglycan/LPS O-acetylase OafA/YrhL